MYLKCTKLSQSLFFYNYLRPVVAVGIIISTLGFYGCATTDSPKQVSTDYDYLVWPLPPEEPRIKYLRALFSEDQIVEAESMMSRLRDNLLGKPAKTGHQLKKPYAVHADKRGRVFVADSGWGKVLVFDEQNKSFDIWGTKGNGILSKPLGISSDKHGNIYVTDSILKRVVVFSPRGQFLYAMGKKGDLTRPVGIAIDDQRNRVYVVDSKEHHIVVFNKKGQLIETIGKRGSNPLEFNFPTNIALDSSGKIYITDSMNFRVHIINPDGSFHKSFGSNGNGRGQFVRAKGIAVDSLNHIYVADAAFNNIQIFDPEGRLLLNLGSMGREPGQFILPAGLYIDPENKIYVADQYNFRVQVFQYLENSNDVKQPEILDKEKITTQKNISRQHDLNDQEVQS